MTVATPVNQRPLDLGAHLRQLAGERAHAHALLDVGAAFLDDAVLECPGLVARELEVDVGRVDRAALVDQLVLAQIDLLVANVRRVISYVRVKQPGES